MSARDVIESGRVTLGIELGSTRIKACLIDQSSHEVLAAGGFEWENRLTDGVWSYELDEVWRGIAAAYAGVAAEALELHGAVLRRPAALGVSAMMHGYLAFDREGELLVPFRTWRNTGTAAAAAELTGIFGQNIPLRWSIAHLAQAVRDDEAHLAGLSSITTLAGYVHRRLSGEHVLGVGDASGMFPIDPATKDYDERMIEDFDALVRTRGTATWASVRQLLPAVRLAGEPAGVLTAEGAALLDPSGALEAGVPLCPPEGDAGTGMVATGAVAPRTGNVSVGTSVFAMVVLEHPLDGVHHEIDLVTTPAGDPVAMVHCNNGASELSAWASLFAEFAEGVGAVVDADAVFAALFAAAEAGAIDAGGVIAYNHLSGEPIAGLAEGRPLVVRTPDAEFNLANFMRAQLYGVFGTLSLGMQVLVDERVEIDRMFAHGGVFKTAGVAQQMLANALDTSVTVAETAAEGGAWGMAVLAAYLCHTERLRNTSGQHARGATELLAYLSEGIDSAPQTRRDPEPIAVAGYRAYLERYRSGLSAEQAAVAALPLRHSRSTKKED